MPKVGPPSFPVRRRTVVAAVTPTVKSECMALVTALHAIPNRDERAGEFKKKLDDVSSETRAVINYMIRKEDDHKLYVNTLLRQIPEFLGRKPHDFSKDPLFSFVTSLRFDCGIDTEIISNMTVDEIQNHYRQESHHPEWETQHQRECSPVDILEMAIDRLSRNLQRNDGNLNEEQMLQYLPQFPLGDNKAKQELYLKYVDQYKDTVQNAYVPRPDD